MNPLSNVRFIKELNEKEIKLGISEKSSWHNEYKDSAWIFVGGLGYNLTEGDVLSVFSQYGEIVNINLIRDKATGKSKGYCFICFEDQRSTILSVDNLNGIKLSGRTIRVDHVANYRIPKDHSELDEITLAVREHGCGPDKPPIPVIKLEDDDIEVIKKPKQDKKKKKKKHRRRSSSSESSSSDDSPGAKKFKTNKVIKTEKKDTGYDAHELPSKRFSDRKENASEFPARQVVRSRNYESSSHRHSKSQRDQSDSSDNDSRKHHRHKADDYHSKRQHKRSSDTSRHRPTKSSHSHGRKH